MREERPDVCFRREAAVPGLFVTLLQPFEGIAAPSLECRLTRADFGGVVALEVTGPDCRDELFAGVEIAEARLASQTVRGRAGLLRRIGERDAASLVVVGQ